MFNVCPIISNGNLVGSLCLISVILKERTMSLSIVIPWSSIVTRDVPEVIVDTSLTLWERPSIITNVTHTNWTAPNPICHHKSRTHKFVLGWSPAISFSCNLTACEPPQCNNRELIIFFIECSSPKCVLCSSSHQL